MPYRPASGDEFPTVHVDDADSVTSDVRLAIVHEQLTIRGKVVDATGAGVADAHISTIGRLGGYALVYARADANGAFVVENLVAGSYDLKAHAADGSSASANAVAAGASDVTMTLAAPGRIDGTLVGFATMPRIYARLLIDDAQAHEATVVGTTFAFTGLPAGTYLISAMLDAAQADGATVEVQSGATATVTLHARARTTLSGRVVELGTGAPVAGMRCHATASLAGSEGPLFGAFVDGAVTDASGQFSIDAPVGRVRVECGGNSSFSDAGGDFDASAPVVALAVKVVSPPTPMAFTVDNLLVPATVVRRQHGARHRRSDRLGRRHRDHGAISERRTDARRKSPSGLAARVADPAWRRGDDDPHRALTYARRRWTTVISR